MKKEKKPLGASHGPRRERKPTEAAEHTEYQQECDPSGYNEHTHQNKPLDNQFMASEDTQYHDSYQSGSAPYSPADNVKTVPRQNQSLLLDIGQLDINEGVETNASQGQTTIGCDDEFDEPAYTFEKEVEVDYADFDDDEEQTSNVQFPYITIPEEYEGDPNDLHLHDMQAAIDQSMQAQYYAVEDENGASSSNLSIPVPSSTSYRHHTPAIGYVVENSSKFEFGAVFKVNWFEPRGVTRKTTDSYTDAGDDPYFYGIRRFIVTQERRGHCVCVGIYTHSRQGCTKRGVHAEYYGQAYDESDGIRPSLLTGEPKLGYPALAISIYPELVNESIDPTSRINFAKPQSVEHNLPVQFIGNIAAEMLPVLVRCATKAWQSQHGNKRKGKVKGKGKGKDRK